MPLSYQNPVWPGYFADPFVLAWRGEFYAYGTGAELERNESGEPGVFKILRSSNLTQWVAAGTALTPNAAEVNHAFWAPEAAVRDDTFYLYYSCAPTGHDERHRLRVATAKHPFGPFKEQGMVLPEAEGFCIDASPFCDPRDGRWYLFFARDFFDERPGTGLAVVPLSTDLLRAVGPSRPVVRANADWQIYERDRPLYGRKWSAWHTVEGPCVVAHDGRYYCFYSGGNWQTQDYGVSFAVAEHPLGPWHHASESGPIVLRQRDDVLGPGHNSYIVAPDGSELLMYHAWDRCRTARRMCLDPLEWTDAGPRCRGPSTSPITW